MTARPTQSKLMMLIVFCAFISIGFPDAVLGVAWPDMRIEFDRARADIGVVLVFNAIGYFVSSAAAGSILERIGVGKTLAFSTLLVAAGLTCYAISPSFWLLPVIAVCVGFGSGAVDAGLNVYAAEKFSNRVMNWLHGFFGIGAMIGPFIMAATLNAGASWRWGYAIVAMVTLLLAIVFVLRMNTWEDVEPLDETKTRLTPRDVLGNKLVWLQISLFFTMVGVEASVGVWTATLLQERFFETAATAGLWAGMYWGSVALGRLAIPVVFPNVPTARVIQAGGLAMLLGVALMIPDSATLMKIGVVIVGLGNAPMFPNLMTLTPHRYGRETAIHTIGFQVSAATAAAAIVPSAAGLLSQATGLIAIPITLTAIAILTVILERQLRTRTGFADTVH